MENPEISIIIPVYNTEEYVSDAILSIMNQTIREIEIIIINDGSTDNSLAIVRELAESDDRIQVYSQENQGQAVARNHGLKQAKGRYVYFMDSDDLLDPQALACCFEKCEKEQLDFVFFDAEVFGDEKWTASFFDYHRSDYVKDHVYQGPEILNLLLDEGIHRSPVWLYLMRHDFIKNTGLTFYPVRHEDELFTAFVYIRAQRVGYIPKEFFKRRLRSNSVMTSQYPDLDINAYLKIIACLLKELTEDNRDVTEKLIRAIINPAIYNANKLSLSKRLHVFLICIRKTYLRFLKIKNIIVLLFPFTIPLKSSILRKNKPLVQT